MIRLGVIITARAELLNSPNDNPNSRESSSRHGRMGI